MKRCLGYIALGAGVSFLGFVFADCATGHIEDITVTVTDKVHIPAHTETTAWVDSDGNFRTSSTFHPDDYQLITTGGSYTCNIGVYEAIGINDRIVASHRKGRWTGWLYLRHVSGEKQL